MRKSTVTYAICAMAVMALACSTETAEEDCYEQCIQRIRLDSVGPVVDTMRIAPDDTAYVVGAALVWVKGAHPDTITVKKSGLMILRSTP